MLIIAYDRANVTSNSTGTGTIALDSAVDGYQNFANVGHDNQIFYTISLPDQSEWEVGVGTVKVVTQTPQTLQAPAGGQTWQLGGVLAPNGDVYFNPSYYGTGTNTGLRLAANNVFSTYSLVYTAQGVYIGDPVLAPNGDIHFAPDTADRGQKVNYLTGIVSTYSLVLTGTNMYVGGVLALNGDVHFVPYAAVRGQRVNGITGAVSTYSLVYTASTAYYGGVRAPNGDIHFVPANAVRGQKVSAAGVVSTYSLVYTNGNEAHWGGVLAPNGDVHFVPFRAGDAGIGQKISIAGVVSTYSLAYASKYAGGVVAENGDIHFTPFSGTVGQKLNVNGVMSTYTILSKGDFGAHIGGVLSRNGLVVWPVGLGSGGMIQVLLPQYSLERNLVIASSNTDNLVNFSAGTKYVFSGTPAAVLPGTVPTGDDSSIGPDLNAWRNYQRLLLKNISAGSVFVNPIAQTYSIPYTVSGGTFAGASINQAGDIHFISIAGQSGTGNSGVKLNYITGIVSTYAIIKSYDAGTAMFIGGVLAPNGDLHMVPATTNVGQKVSVAGIVSTYTLVRTGNAIQYSGGVLGSSGDIHFVPRSGPVGQKISATGVVSTYQLVYTTSSAYQGGVLAPNGDIHFVPLRAEVGQKVAVDGTVSTYSLVYTTRDAYLGGVLDLNGNIHFINNDAVVGQEVNGITGAVSTYSLLLTGNGAYAGGVLGPDGEIYFVPAGARVGQRVNSITGAVSTYSLVYTTASSAYSGGVLAPNGAIYLSPSLADRGQVIVPTGRPFDLDVVTNPFFSKY